ncbi:MAG: serine/threonine-protein kinase PknK [Polyangiaceae bacterium]|nr:serine/threonine-protein kinase PknK [Polyangiaceae bacterium]
MVTTTTTRIPGSRKTLCRGERHVLHLVPSSEGPNVYKIPVADTPTQADVASLQNELFATRDLNIQGVRRALRMERVDGRPALVLAYAPGEALVPRRVQTRADLRSTLEMAVRICRVLGELHAAGVIHKNLQPAHILFDPVSHEVSLIGMRFAARVDLKQAHLASPKQLQGTLAYMSPEQTGRMNRVVDYRADLYSLGVTLYELLTGRTPFDSADPLELVHCHIAKSPLPANSVNPEVPSAVSLLVGKLLSKSADDRYQSAFGLSHDLEKCLALLHESGTVDIFPLAALDRSGRFRLPHKLYGRVSQADLLCRAFERASDGRCELVLVTGGSGVGKSALVHEVLRSLGEKRGSFAEGKFEQLLRNIPYHALVQAFRSILGRVLTEDNTSLAAFRERILPATSGVGKVLTDLVPTLELIIGEQPAAPDVGGEEMQNRFLRALTQFVQALAPREHPMVLFLDDLQWADSASLALLKVLLTDTRTRNVLFVAAYRDQEVTPGHPLGQFLTEIQKALVPVETIHLTNLVPGDVHALTADSLQTDIEKAQPLADVVFEKTGGNAFFVGQFLHSLAIEGLLKFDHQDQSWHWNLSEVRRAATASDVLELIGERLRRLPKLTLRALQIASCVGARFKLEKVATTSSQTSAEVLRELWPAVEAGLLRPENDGFPLAGADLDTEVDAVTEFSFVHDRVQQAAYASLAEETRRSVHLSIGRSALKQLKPDSAAGQVFDVVNQLNAGASLVTTPSERLELAHLNLRAGRAARDSVAFRQAIEYFRAGQSLLGPTPWQTHYGLMVALRGAQAEAASCVGEEHEAETAAREVLTHGVTPADKDLAYHALQTVARTRDRLDESLAVGLEALEQYGVRFPKNPGGHHIGMEMVRIRWLMRGRTIESLGDAPEMRDPNAIAAMRMMDRINVTAFRAGSKIYPLLLLRQLREHDSASWRSGFNIATRTS